MHSHPIVKEMEAFWQEHAGRHDDPLWLAYLSAYNDLLRAKMVEMGEAHSNEGRFGMSKAGGCTRAASLKFLGHESQLTGSTRATFAIGHQVEVMALATLKALGYPLNNVQRRVTIDPMMSSSLDAETVLDDVETIVSVKSAGYKMSGQRKGTWTRYGFAQYPLDGVKKTSPGYWVQAQAEMHGARVSQSLLIVVAKDMIKKFEDDPLMQENGSLTFYAELIPYDGPFCSEQLAAIWGATWGDVLDGNAGDAFYFSGKENRFVLLDPHDGIANKAMTGTYSPCDYCDLRDACTLAAPLEASTAASLQEGA